MNTPIISKTNFINKLLGLFTIFTLVTLMFSCLENDDNIPETIPVSYVSFYHGAPNATTLNIEVDNKLVNNGINNPNSFSYGEYFGYSNFFTGKRNFSFKQVNAANSLYDTAVTFVADKAYSFFLSEEGATFEPIIVEDKLKNPESGKALMRLVHLSPDSPPVNLRIGNSENSLFNGKEFKEVTDFESIDAGNLSFHILTGQNENPLVSATNINIREGRIYTLIVRGHSAVGAGSAKALGIQIIRNYPSY